MKKLKVRTKHLSIKLRFVHQNLQLGNIYIVHTSSINNVADLMTKSLSKRLFMQHRKSIVISSLGRKSTLSERRGSVRKVFSPAEKAEVGLHTCQNFSSGVSENSDKNTAMHQLTNGIQSQLEVGPLQLELQHT